MESGGAGKVRHWSGVVWMSVAGGKTVPARLTAPARAWQQLAAMATVGLLHVLAPGPAAAALARAWLAAAVTSVV
jgi:hypothetical protein